MYIYIIYNNEEFAEQAVMMTRLTPHFIIKTEKSKQKKFKKNKKETVKNMEKQPFFKKIGMFLSVLNKLSGKKVAKNLPYADGKALAF